MRMSTKSTPAVQAAKTAGLAFRLLEYDYDPAAQSVGLHAAASLGLPAAKVFKTLVVALDGGEFVCAVIPANARLDLKAVAAAAGGKRAELADPARAERSTGYVVGGISPLGQRRRLRTFVDASAPELDEMVVNGGRRGLQIALRPADLIAAAAAKVARLASFAPAPS
jgi:Cys-tRNA(Pro)/Cys-tRNA(Cys) deacylase